METDRWLTEKEVAVITGLALPTLRNQRYLRRGIPFAKIGKAVRYRYADIARFMEARLVEMRDTG